MDIPNDIVSEIATATSINPESLIDTVSSNFNFDSHQALSAAAF